MSTILGFSAVEYAVGPFYQRRNVTQGLQVDLIFKRKDKVLTVCEIKYTDAKTTRSVISDFERKLALIPEQKRYSIQKI